MHAWNLSMYDEAPWLMWVPGQPGLCSEFECSLSCRMKSYFLIKMNEMNLQNKWGRNNNYRCQVQCSSHAIRSCASWIEEYIFECSNHQASSQWNTKMERSIQSQVSPNALFENFSNSWSYLLIWRCVYLLPVQLITILYWHLWTMFCLLLGLVWMF